MKTLLINPPYPFFEHPLIPLGLSYVAGSLEHNRHEVQVLDLLVSKYSKEKITRKIEEFQPDIVGITSVTLNYPIASEILKYCKGINGDITTVIGGPHVTFSAVETLTEAPWIDVVVRGEGELTMLDIVKWKRPEDIPGIACRTNGTITLTDERPLIENLDELPPPARHLFPLSRYHALDSHYSLVTGRGCPFSCIFCVGSKMGGRRVRYRDAKLVVDEIEEGLSRGFKDVNIENDHLTVNHNHLHAICDEIMRRGLKFNWHAFSRVDTVNPEMMRRLKEAGCSYLCYGVESGNQHILDGVKKKITLQKVRDAVKIAKDAGIDVQAAFILGLPGESRETMMSTLEFAQQLDTFYGLHVLAPFPGTEVREKAEEYGIEILTDDWSKYDANRPVTRTAECSPEDITALLHRYYRGLRLTQDELDGIESDQAEIEKRKRRPPLAWTLLHGDVIESLGAIQNDGSAIEDLASALARLVPYSASEIRENTGKWFDRGLLKYDVVGSNVVWKWS
ncbi:MAG: cobalamin-dependent protein [Dehalococcoidia bacterium]|nr:MAG: cobalamin-dependent protein [Dehalococcoidia bacterium]